MQQSCPRCGFSSDRPTRFCRQCGAQLFAENDATSATTRQYAPQQPVNPQVNRYDTPYQSQFAQSPPIPDGRLGQNVTDTSPFYNAPMAQNYPNYPANQQLTEKKKSGVLKWVLITLLCVLLVSAGVGVMVISAIRASRPPVVQIPVPVEPPEPGIPPAPPAPPAPPTGRASSELSKYTYPGAAIDKKVKVFGIETFVMHTNDSIDQVKKFYQPMFGEPLDENTLKQTVVYQADNGSLLVTIKPDESHPGQIQIVIVRTPFQIPK